MSAPASDLTFAAFLAKNQDAWNNTHAPGAPAAIPSAFLAASTPAVANSVQIHHHTADSVTGMLITEMVALKKENAALKEQLAVALASKERVHSLRRKPAAKKHYDEE